ncbi:MAG: AAA family ATPase [Lachnospiraceae bacterium]|nr:AAA family ATPase [Lachnospiraceae bacterium]
MGINLKGIEIENFKSYVNKQYIKFSDLSVLLGANSSGKSTALQALLVIKQTMECNSPDEELLLSGKFVALGDYDDVISDAEKEFFSFAAVLEQTEQSENMADEDAFKICWNFKRGDDGISAILDHLDIDYESMQLSFRRSNNGMHHLYIDNERSPFSARINNLLISKYIIHYDTELNIKASELLNDISRILISQKIPTVASEEPVGVAAIENFYFRLLDQLQDDDVQKALEPNKKNLAVRLGKLIDDFGNLQIPRYEAITRSLPKDLRVKMIEMAFANINISEDVEKIIIKYEEYLQNYKLSIPMLSEFTGFFHLGSDPFRLFDRDDGKEDNLTQLKYALEFYKTFFINIISNIFFVGPIRETPKGLYNIGFETVPKYVGPMGSYFASVLLHENKKEREYIMPDGKERCVLSEALAAWMIHLNIATSVNVDKKNSFGFSVSIENMEQVKSDIMNVGIGTSQVLPVLISVLLSEPNELLIFEQPELHLHPYSQSRLADMFVSFCKQGRKVILETHSEYFILRLRYHIVKENFPSKYVAVNFFQNLGGTQVDFTNISGLGNLEYPTDFRDETQDLLDAILEAALERKGLS